MPLLDHFTPPVPPRAAWQSFHHRWAGAIADHLDATLPAELFARVEVNLGTEVAADVAEFEESSTDARFAYNPPPQLSWPVKYPDDAAVEVRTEADGGRLLAVVELVSPSNKDRPASRAAFAAKCAAYLQAGVGLVVVDVVHAHHFNLYNHLAALLGATAGMPGDPPAYAAAYRPTADASESRVDVWAEGLAVGRPLPTLPLALRGRGAVPLDLEGLYAETCRRARLLASAAA